MILRFIMHYSNHPSVLYREVGLTEMLVEFRGARAPLVNIVINSLQKVLSKSKFSINSCIILFYAKKGNNDSNKCSAVVGDHEPVITLKDNNMVMKLRLNPDHAFHVIDTLMR